MKRLVSVTAALLALLGPEASSWAASATGPEPEGDGPTRTLPVVEIPASRVEDSHRMGALLLTGDGGFSTFSKRISSRLASRGIPVAAISSLRYFWRRRDPDEAARDLEQILDQHLGTWQKERAILIGYSFGADVLPFIVSRLSQEAREKVGAIVLLGPALSVDFKFHLSYWFLGSRGKYPMSVGEAVLKLDRSRILCVHGEEEKHSLCRDADSDGMKVASISGGHRLGRHPQSIADMIVNEALGLAPD